MLWSNSIVATDCLGWLGKKGLSQHGMCPAFSRADSQRKPPCLNLCRQTHLPPWLVCLIKQSKSLALIPPMALNCFNHCEVSHTMHFQCKQVFFSPPQQLFGLTSVGGSAPLEGAAEEPVCVKTHLKCLYSLVSSSGLLMCLLFHISAVPRVSLLWLLDTLTWRHLCLEGCNSSLVRQEGKRMT